MRGRGTHVDRDAADRPDTTSQSLLELLRHQPSKHRVDVQRLLVGGQVV
jgi:hypothetical protein